MTHDEIRDWLISEMETEGEQYQEARRNGWHDAATTHFARVDMLVRTLYMTDLADRAVASGLARRYLGEDARPEDAAEEPDS